MKEQLNEQNKTIVKKSLIRKPAKKYPIIFGLGIVAIMVAHFVFQMNFIQTEQFRVVEVAVKTDNAEIEKPAEKIEKTVPQIVNIFPEVYEVQKIKVMIPAKVAPEPRREEVKVPVAKVPVRKKAMREKEEISKNERLRRAEKLLTGY